MDIREEIEAHIRACLKASDIDKDISDSLSKSLMVLLDGLVRELPCKMVTVDKSGAIPHFHYQGSDKGLVSYDLAGEFEHGEEGCLIFIPKGHL